MGMPPAQRCTTCWRVAAISFPARHPPAGWPFSSTSRARAQSIDLAPPLDGQPLYWLGKAGDAQSLAWLEQLDRRVAGEPARRELLAAASYHRDAESVNAWLG